MEIYKIITNWLACSFEKLKIFFDTIKAGFTPAVIIWENQGHFLAYFSIISCCISCCIVLYIIGFLSRLSVFYHFYFDEEKPREASNHAGFSVFSTFGVFLMI